MPEALKVIILTSEYKGTAAHHLPYLLNNKLFTVIGVVHNNSQVRNKKKYYVQKLKKTFKIGLLGAINGLRMRKWFTSDTSHYVEIKDIREYCGFYNIPFFEVDSINGSNTIGIFNKLNADLGVSLGNSYISKKIFSIPKFGMINIHHEILPAYQNAQSIIWQIFNGSSSTGYTIHMINSKIDAGNILFQEKVDINFESTLRKTVSSTSAKLLLASAKGLVYVLENFVNLKKHSKPQGKGKHYTTPSFMQFLKIYKNYKRILKQQKKLVS